MSCEEMAEKCEEAARVPAKARHLLLELAKALRDYRPQTHVETYALAEVFERATSR